MKALPAVVPSFALMAALSACGMLAVKDQQAKIDANCMIGGRVTPSGSTPRR